MSRIPRHNYLMELAHITAKRGTCFKKQVGCVIAHDGVVISMGYNSSHPKTKHCDEVGCLDDGHGHCKRCLHAEVAAVVNLVKNNTVLTGPIQAYVTLGPCSDCYKLLAAIGCDTIYYGEPYHNKMTEELKRLIGIPIIQIEP